MRVLFGLLFAILATPALAQTAPGSIAPADVAGFAIEGFVRPEFDKVHKAAEVLAAEIETFCGAASEPGLKQVRAAFGDALTAYARTEFLRFGPLATDNRLERLLFWPDAKGIALKQVQAALAGEDESALTPEGLRQKSVALQGFTTLEYLLFGTGADALAQQGQPSYRCRFAHSVARSIAAQVGAARAEWAADGPGSIAARLTRPSAEDAEYRSTREVLEEFVGAMSHWLEAMRDQRLLPFLGRDGGAPKPKSALFWRSGLTVPVIRANFEGVRDFFRLSRIAKAGGPETGWIEGTVAFEFANVERAADAISAPVEAALEDHRQHQALDYLAILSNSLQTLIGEHVAAALGLSVGFSSLDGD